MPDVPGVAGVCFRRMKTPSADVRKYSYLAMNRDLWDVLLPARLGGVAIRSRYWALADGTRGNDEADRDVFFFFEVAMFSFSPEICLFMMFCSP